VEVDRIIAVTVRKQTKAAKLLGGGDTNSDRNVFVDFEPMEVAQQLTLLMHTLFIRVPLSELLHMNFREQETAPNFHWLKVVANRISFAFVSEILAQEDVTQRALVMERLIRIAELCLNMRNFDSLVTIVSVLGTSAIHRLRNSWTKVAKRIPGRWENMKEVAGVAGRNLQSMMNDAASPAVPCVGVVLKNLINFNEEPNSVGDENDLINFHKMRKIGEVLRQWQDHQETPYIFEPVPEILNLLLRKPTYQNEDQCWARSQDLEAKKT